MYFNLHTILRICILYTLQYQWLLVIARTDEDIFQQDIGNNMEIGLADKGYKSVELKCGSEMMVVNLETDDDFLGVIYTRGSFYDKKMPCYHDRGYARGQKSFQIKIPFNKCNTVQDNNIYSNVLILQHDKELIMPGDAAFNLECDFSKPRDVTVTASLESVSEASSRITLVDADPSKQMKKNDNIATFESYTSTVVITPDRLRLRKEEL